jgi:hypothetical protein
VWRTHLGKRELIVAGATDQSVVGRTGAPFAMAVELGKVREFARATRSRNPSHNGAPGDTPTVPATFLVTAGLWQTPDSNPWSGVGRNLERILHGEEEYTFYGPPPKVGDVLIGTSRIDKVYDKTGKRGGTMTFCELVTEFCDRTGVLVAEARTTTIETGPPAS